MATYYGRNMKTGEVLEAEEDGKCMYLRVNKDINNHYAVKTIDGKLSGIVSPVGRNVRKPEYTKITEQCFNMFMRFIETGNNRYLTQAERMM